MSYINYSKLIWETPHIQYSLFIFSTKLIHHVVTVVNAQCFVFSIQYLTYLFEPWVNSNSLCFYFPIFSIQYAFSWFTWLPMLWQWSRPPFPNQYSMRYMTHSIFSIQYSLSWFMLLTMWWRTPLFHVFTREQLQHPTSTWDTPYSVFSIRFLDSCDSPCDKEPHCSSMPHTYKAPHSIFNI